MKLILSSLIVVLLASAMSSASSLPYACSSTFGATIHSCLSVTQSTPDTNQNSFDLAWHFSGVKYYENYTFREEIADEPGHQFDVHFAVGDYIPNMGYPYSLLVTFGSTQNYWARGNIDQGPYGIDPGPQEIWCSLGDCLELQDPFGGVGSWLKFTGMAPGPGMMGYYPFNFSGSVSVSTTRWNDHQPPIIPYDHWTCQQLTPVCPFDLGGSGFVQLQWHNYGSADGPPIIDYAKFTFDDLHERQAPEPGSLLLLGTGVLGIAGMIRQKLSA
jgi:hypothetical protein